jgi:hypothetical protein
MKNNKTTKIGLLLLPFMLYGLYLSTEEYPGMTRFETSELSAIYLMSGSRFDFIFFLNIFFNYGFIIPYFIIGYFVLGFFLKKINDNKN